MYFNESGNISTVPPNALLLGALAKILEYPFTCTHFLYNK